MTAPQRRIPLAAKLVYTAFVALLVPVYLYDYGPTNFCYFCDIALLLTVFAVWRENKFVASLALVGILVPQIVWIVDFLGMCLGLGMMGATSYMFDEKIPLFTRFLSFFHFWLPLYLLYVVWRLGYDKRAFWWCWAGGSLVLCISYFLLPPPPAPVDNPNLPVNVNYVYGLSLEAPQQNMSGLAYLGLLLALLPIIAYIPAHLILSRWFVRREEAVAAAPR